ncbi:MAG: ABC transporter ATP-binding protein [Deltaproteobacteria bacterium]|nr:ABC transporter ATP-binding protein [Deltaproteobacteria bacterium]
MLRVEDLHFSYGGRPVLKGISFRIPEGVLCGVFGPNGCGKTTLFKCCLRFLSPRKGAIYVAGADIRRLKVRDMAKLAAYVPQEHKPPFPYRVREVVLMGRTPHLSGFLQIGKGDRDKAMEAMELLAIEDLAEAPYNHLSGGQRQLVLIARAIAQETRVVFLDEPTSALDFSNQVRIWEILRRVAGRGITVLACCHDPNHVSWYCDEVVLMNGTGVIGQGTPKDVIHQDTLDKIYRGVCDVRSLGKRNMVLPRNLEDTSGPAPMGGKE